MNWRNGVCGDFSYSTKKRGGVLLRFKGAIIWEAPTVKMAKAYAARCLSEEITPEPAPYWNNQPNPTETGDTEP